MSNLSIPPFLLKPLRTPLLAIAIPVVFGSLSGLPTSQRVKGVWYRSLRAPPFQPPQIAFPIVWPVLYAAMGYASHIAIRHFDMSASPVQRRLLSRGLKLYYAQLAMNILWTPLFFGAKMTFALVDIVALTGTTFVMTASLHGATAGATTWYLAPYCAWLSFATYLNVGYWWLNGNREDLRRLD